jgi:coenzyme F420-dependent glucose-6-phosphate dehydrogenase
MRNMSKGISFGFFGINELHSPEELVSLIVSAEKYGWDMALLSDHFHPWTHAGINCNFCWVVLTAAAEHTRRIKIGSGVTAPAQRYHPALIAQAFATLAVMYPGRIILGLGSGEPINEMALGSKWPSASMRLQRFDEGLRIIRLLFDRDFVSFTGEHFSLSTATLYTKPPKSVPIYVAATGPKSAKIAGRYADGIIVPIGELPIGEQTAKGFLEEKILPALRSGAKEMDRDPNTIKIVLHLMMSYDEDWEKALHSSTREYWNHTVISNLFDIPTSDPRVNQKKYKFVDDKTFLKYWIVEATPEAHIKRLEPFFKMNIDELMILSASPDEEKFLRVFGKEVLPYFKDSKDSAKSR